VTYSDRSVGDLDGGNGYGTTADAIDEILLVVVASVKADFMGADVGIEDRFGAGVEAMASVDVDPALCTYEANALAKLVGICDDKCETSGVFASNFVAIGNVPESAGAEDYLFGLNPDGAGVLGIHAPLCDVEMMCSPVGYQAAGVVVNPPPAQRHEGAHGAGPSHTS